MYGPLSSIQIGQVFFVRVASQALGNSTIKEPINPRYATLSKVAVESTEASLFNTQQVSPQSGSKAI